jgi:RimJ/RimL family protein N-acetyltransferase
MRARETKRLILRKFTYEDFDAVHGYAACPENLVYVDFLNSENDTRSFLEYAVSCADATPVSTYEYAVTLKDGGKLIGGGKLAVNGSQGSLGWVLHKDYWGQGYGTELGNELLVLGFGELGLRRIISSCDSENVGSYRVMEKIGMRREGLFIEARPAHKLSAEPYGDELRYAILSSEWLTHKEIIRCNALPFEFNGFADIPELTDGEIYLVCLKKHPADPEKNYVPWYSFAVCKDGEQIGTIDLRIGYEGGKFGKGLYYGGQIGYTVNKPHRGNGYAARAARLLAPVAKAHKMDKLHITVNVTNTASIRVCEKLGTKLIDTARVPEWHNLYEEGYVHVNIYEWNVND